MVRVRLSGERDEVNQRMTRLVGIFRLLIEEVHDHTNGERVAILIWKEEGE